MLERKSERGCAAAGAGRVNLDDLRRLMRYARGRTYAVSAKWPIRATASSRALIDDLLTLGFDRFVVLERKNTLRRVVRAHRNPAQGLGAATGTSPMLRQVELPLQFPNGDTLCNGYAACQDWYAKARQRCPACPRWS